MASAEGASSWPRPLPHPLYRRSLWAPGTGTGERGTWVWAPIILCLWRAGRQIVLRQPAMWWIHVLMRDERRKKERSKQDQTNNKAKQHSTPKAVTFPKENELFQVGLEPTTLYTLDRALYHWATEAASAGWAQWIHVGVHESRGREIHVYRADWSWNNGATLDGTQTCDHQVSRLVLYSLSHQESSRAGLNPRYMYIQ